MEGPRGAKPWTSEEVDTVGDGGAESPPLPSPSRAISTSCRMPGVCSAAHTLEELGQRRVFMYHALHRVRYYRMLRVVWLGVECRRVTQLVGCAFRVLRNAGENQGRRGDWRL